MSRLLGDLLTILHEGRGDVAFTRLQDLNPAVFIDGGHRLIGRSITHLHIGGISRTYSCLDSGFRSSLSLTSRLSGTVMSFAATLTVTLQTALISESVTLAVMSASPAETATTMPVASTVATLSSEEVHPTVSLLAALASFPVSFSASTGCSSLGGHGRSIVGAESDRQNHRLTFSTVTASGTAMFVIFTPHPTRVIAIAAAATTAKMIVLRFIFNFSFTSRRLVPGPHLTNQFNVSPTQLWTSPSTMPWTLLPPILLYNCIIPSMW